MTLNLGLLAWRPFGLAGIAIDRHIEERLAAAPAHLRESGADIVALQEVYASRDRRFLQESLKDVYPYSFAPWKPRSVLGNGLMVLSRYPITQAEFMRRHRAPGSHSAISEKGCLCTDIEVPDYGILRLINLHLTVDEQRPHGPNLNLRRFAEIDEILAIARCPDRAPAFLVGDFNCGPIVNADIYQRIIAAGFADAFTATPQHRSADAITWDRNNPLNASGRHRHCPSQRIDHLFVPSSLAMNAVPVMSSIEFNKATVDVGRDRKVTLSDHYGFSVSLALQGDARSRSAGSASLPHTKQVLPVF